MLDKYLQLRANTESPPQFHRWSFLSCTAAALGRNLYLQHGTKRIYPVLYTMLTGTAGGRKSAALTACRSLLTAAGFKGYASSRTSKQQFLMDMQEKMLEYELDDQRPYASFIAEDEFIDFMGVGNLEFTGLLINLWDCKDNYEEVYRKSKVYLHQPTVNILGGITPTSLNLALPSEAGGMGLLSRMILVYGQQRSVRIAFPEVPTPEQEEPFVRYFMDCMDFAPGAVQWTPEAKEFVAAWYNDWENLPDQRLLNYCGRRQEHMLRLCLVLCGMYRSDRITYEIALEANSILVFTEEQMHKAFGEQGKGKYSEASYKLLSFMESQRRPLSVEELYRAIASDLERYNDLLQILQNLTHCDRIASANGHYILKNATRVDRRKYTNLARYIIEAEEHERDIKHQADLASAIERARSAVNGSGKL